MHPPVAAKSTLARHLLLIHQHVIDAKPAGHRKGAGEMIFNSINSYAYDKKMDWHRSC